MRPILPFLVVAGLSSCGGAAPGARPATVGAPALAPLPVAGNAASMAPTVAATSKAPTHTLARSAVHAVVAQGLGYFLQRVELDDQPVFEGQRFHGFRIARLHDEKFWDGVDLMAGDVVTSVNGLPIERPEQAQTAFDSLEVSSELRVAYERAGQGRELVYSIVDDL
jgi:type II secretory pathway component PulC